MSKHRNPSRKPDETKDQYFSRRARGMAANIMASMAECREGAGWPPEKETMLNWFAYHRARLHERLALAARLP